MNKATLYKAAIVSLGVMISATVVEAMPAASSLGTVPAITNGGAQIEKTAIVIVKKRVRRPRVVVKKVIVR